MTRKDGGVVERAALEMQCTGDCTGGSNPPLSASNTQSQKERLKLKRLRPFSFLKRFLNDSEYIEGYIIVPRETGTNYRRNISQIKNYGTLKRTETRLYDETIIHSAVCRNPDCHPLCRTYLSTSYRSCSNDSNRNNFLASAHLREQATIEKTDIVKRCPKRERRTPTLFLILTFGSKKFAKRNERILSQHRCSMPSS